MSAVVCGKRSNIFEESPSSPPVTKRIRCSSSSSPGRTFSPPTAAAYTSSTSAIDHLVALFPDMDKQVFVFQFLLNLMPLYLRFSGSRTCVLPANWLGENGGEICSWLDLKLVHLLSWIFLIILTGNVEFCKFHVWGTLLLLLIAWPRTVHSLFTIRLWLLYRSFSFHG